MLHCRSDTALADGSQAESVDHLENMVEHPNQSQPNQVVSFRPFSSVIQWIGSLWHDKKFKENLLSIVVTPLSDYKLQHLKGFGKRYEVAHKTYVA